MTLSQIGEFGLIELIAKKLKHSAGVVKGIGDDTAVLNFSAKEYLLLTTDMSVEDVHFRRRTPPELIGRKALGRNISDIAAMGGAATYAVVSLGVPPAINVHFIQKIYQGMLSLAEKFSISIVGGDTVKNGKMIINVALMGRVAKKHLVLRKGAKPGDRIFTSGKLGGSLNSGRHLTFQPRMREAQYLVRNFHPTAMIDISDGLVADLGHVLKESGVGAELSREKIPVNAKATIQQALYDGEDFELLFTVAPKDALRLRKTKQFRFYEIGRIVKSSQGLTMIDGDKKKEKIKAHGFVHF